MRRAGTRWNSRVLRVITVSRRDNACPEEDHDCVRPISPEAVVQATYELLNETKGVSWRSANVPVREHANLPQTAGS